MATPVIMPKFGMAQEDGTILRWLKQPGDIVEKGDILLEVQTDKVDMEVESPSGGVLGDVRFGPDETVRVTTVIATIFAPGETQPHPPQPVSRPAAVAASSSFAESARLTPVAQRMAAEGKVDLTNVVGTGPAGRITKADVQSALATAEPANESRSGGRVRATPAARRLAREGELELAGVPGTGPAGRIQAEDVATMLAAAAVTAAPVETAAGVVVGGGEAQLLRGMRKTIAVRLTQSWQSIPHIFLSASIDMSAVETLRARLQADVDAQGARLTPTVFIAKAVASTLRRQSRLNAWLRHEGDQFWVAEQAQIDLGIAVALEDGLIVPVVRNADQLGLAALAGRIGELARRAREGKLSPDHVAAGTFTISNLGAQPIDHFTAIINPPQVGILAVGRAQVQPVWDGVQFSPRPMMQVTLSADHRAVDGAVGAAFLAELKRLLEEPARMLL